MLYDFVKCLDFSCNTKRGFDSVGGCKFRFGLYPVATTRQRDIPFFENSMDNMHFKPNIQGRGRIPVAL